VVQVCEARSGSNLLTVELRWFSIPEIIEIFTFSVRSLDLGIFLYVSFGRMT
jgi:hypothetical protein